MTERFVGLARASHERARMPEAPLIVLPPSEETEYSDPDRMAQIVDASLTRVVDALVAPKGVPEQAEVGPR